MAIRKKRRKSGYIDGRGGNSLVYNKRMVIQGRNLALMDYTHEKMAEFFGITIGTLYVWKRTHPDFKEALNTKRDVNDGEVVRSLFEIATGYDYVERKKEVVKDPSGGENKTKITKTKKHIPPNVGAIKVWLYNRRPKEFKPEPALSSHEDADKTPAPPLTINYSVNPPARCVKATIGKDG